jgi:DNA modification methylase
MYKWFCPVDGAILDPFAGGEVRGVVASVLGCKYFGVDLSKEQISGNMDSIDRLGLYGNEPTWVTGDSETVLAFDDIEPFDMVFTCPPYGSLERYSDDQRDLSNMSEKRFVDKYSNILRLACKRTKDNSFISIVISNYREDGFYKNLVGLTINIMEIESGFNCRLYNDMVYVAPNGTAPMRAPMMFNASRKVCRLHQNVLVFVKGDVEKATEKLRGSNGI